MSTKDWEYPLFETIVGYAKENKINPIEMIYFMMSAIGTMLNLEGKDLDLLVKVIAEYIANIVNTKTNGKQK